jgi:hypothetical protein
MSGLPGSVAGWWPSPNRVMNQSAVADAVDAVGARGAALGVVVLRAAVDVVEGLVVVDRDLVELRHRQVGDEAPGLREVEALVEAAVVPTSGSRGRPGGRRARGRRRACAVPQPARNVLPPSCEIMWHVIEVDAARRRAGWRRAPGSSAGRCRRRRCRSASPTTAPRSASGRRRPCGGRARSRRRHVGILRREREADLAQVAFGQARLQLLQVCRRRSSGGGPTRAAADVGRDGAVTLPGGGVEPVRDRAGPSRRR